MTHKRTIKTGIQDYNESPYEALCKGEGALLYSWRDVTCPECIKLGHPIYKYKKPGCVRNPEGRRPGGRNAKTIQKWKEDNTPKQPDLVKFKKFLKENYE